MHNVWFDSKTHKHKNAARSIGSGHCIVYINLKFKDMNLGQIGKGKHFCQIENPPSMLFVPGPEKAWLVQMLSVTNNGFPAGEHIQLDMEGI